MGFCPVKMLLQYHKTKICISHIMTHKAKNKRAHKATQTVKDINKQRRIWSPKQIYTVAFMCPTLLL